MDHGGTAMDGKKNKDKLRVGEKEAEQDSWSIANRYAELYGNMPSSFTSTIRGLTKDETSAQNIRWQLRRLLRSDSVRAPFYFAARTFKKEKLPANAHLNPDALLDVFLPREVAAIVALLYLYRRAKKLCDPKEFELLTGDLAVRSEAGGFLGMSMPNIGFTLGLLAGTARPLALAAFLLHDEKGFSEYRRRLKVTSAICDLPAEVQRWGCSHNQVASSLLIKLGFTSDTAESVHLGFGMKELKDEKSHMGAYAVKCTEVWTNAVLKTVKPPDIVHSGNFYPLKEDLAVLLQHAKELSERGSQYTWLEKKRSDLPAGTVPAGRGIEEEEGLRSLDEELE